jgi:hypothetical protein
MDSDWQAGTILKVGIIKTLDNLSGKERGGKNG